MDNSCEKYMQMLSPYLDGELTTSEEKELKSHLESCEMCSALLESYRAIDSDAMVVNPPEGFAAKVMDKVRKEAAPKKKRIIPFRYGTLAAAMVALVLLGASGVFGNLFDGVGLKSSSPDSVENAMTAMDEALENKASIVRGNEAAFAAAPAAAAGEAAAEEASVEEAAVEEAAIADTPLAAAVEPAPEPETPAEFSMMEAIPEAGDDTATNVDIAEAVMVTGTLATVEAAEDGYNTTLENADVSDYNDTVIFVPNIVAGDIDLSPGLTVSVKLGKTDGGLEALSIQPA